MTRALAAAVLALACACSRSNESAPGPAPASAPAPAPAPAPASALASAPALALAPAGEATRRFALDLTKEPDLAAHRDRLRDHFGDPSKGPFAIQKVGLAWGRTGILVARADESDPIILVTEGDRVVYAKEHPAGGISPPPRAITLVAHPAGGAAYVAFVPKINVVAMRIWADDANPFADMQLFAIDACDALSAAYAPGAGWLVAAAKKGETRAQWIRDDGSLAWGPDGRTIAAPWRAAAPPSIVFDTPKTAVVVAYASGGADRDHVMAFRYDDGERMLWSAPVDLGAVPRVQETNKRIDARLAPSGAVRVELAGAAAGGASQAVEIDASGRVRATR